MNRVPTLLIEAVIKVEAGTHRSFKRGCLVIPKRIVDDVNRVHSREFVTADIVCRAPAVEVFRLYVSHHASAAKLRRAPTMEDMVRIWKGGPSGHRKAITLPFWRAVDAAMQAMLIQAFDATPAPKRR